MSEAMKCAIIINETLPIGLAINAAAIMGLTLGAKYSSLIGPDLLDGSEQWHAGITTIPIPILRAEPAVVQDIRLRAAEIEGIFIVDFTDAAQTTTTYEAYQEKLRSMSAEELTYLAVALYGNKKTINKLTGNLPLLR